MAVWSTLLLAAIGVIVFFILQSGGHRGMEGPIPVGEQVQAFELPDVVSGQNASIANYLGKQEIVIVCYMGFF